MVKLGPGLAFSLVCDLGFAVGLVTHVVPGMTDLVWLADSVFEDPPDLADVASVAQWRWPIFFPARAAVRRKLVDTIGIVEIPAGLKQMPPMRGGGRQMGWREMSLEDGVYQMVPGGTAERSMPIASIVNLEALRQMLVEGWTPDWDW